MSDRLLWAIAVACGILLGLMLPIPAAQAWSRCQYFSDGREPRCLNTSDSGREQYYDDRNRRGSSWERFRQSRKASETERGRTHTQDMATGGTMMGGILVSPFVPGSDADKGWQAERKRRGLCGNDRLCNNQ